MDRPCMQPAVGRDWKYRRHEDWVLAVEAEQLEFERGHYRRWDIPVDRGVS